MPSIVRPPAVAGAFYPADPVVLDAAVRGYLAAAQPLDPGFRTRILIVPHAGYVYSGPIAASAYTHLVGGRETVQRVILLGPAHRVALRGLAASSAQAFATPIVLAVVCNSFRYCISLLAHGALAQLGERLVCTQPGKGSNPF